MIIAQISDTHITMEDEARDNRLANLDACLNHINALTKAPDIVIHSGDLSHNNLEPEYLAVTERMDKLKVPHYFIPGNRDESSVMRTMFGKRFPLTSHSEHFSYIIDDFPVRLIALDTTSKTSGLGQFCDDRASFLKEALAMEAQLLGNKPLAAPLVKPVLIFMHHPPYEVHVSSGPRQYENWNDAVKFQEIVQAHQGKIRIICGHVHRNSFGNIGEIATSTMPSVALDLRRKNDPLVVADEIMYHIHEFGPDGNCATRLVRAPLPLKEMSRIEHPVPGGMAV